MQRFKHPAGLCALTGALLGLAFGRFRATSLLGVDLWENWPLLIPAAILVVLAWTAKEEPEPGPRPGAAKLTHVFAGFCLFGAGALALLGRDPADPFGMIAALFPVLSGFGILLSASDKEGELPALGTVIPIFYQGYLLLQLYRANATDTHRATFAVELFCVIAILLSVYGAASRRFLPYNRLRVTLFGGLGLYAAGLMLVPCVLAGEYVLGLTWVNGTLLLAQLGLAVHGAAGILFAPPLPEEDEDQEEEEDEIDPDWIPDPQTVENDHVVSEERNPK